MSEHILGTAMFTNGSDEATEVSIQGGKTLAFVTAGTVAFIEGPNLSVEEALGPTEQGFQLGRNWTQVTGTYTFRMMYTPENLGPAIAVVRQYGELLGDAAAINASLTQKYNSIAEGLSNTGNNEFFHVVGTGETFVTQYQNVAGAAIEKASLPSQAGIEDAKSATNNNRNLSEGFKDAAETAANSANTSAGDAATSVSNAATSESNAETSASNAAASESNAETSASNAATSESNAATSASNAAASESNAAVSESNAASYAANAVATANLNGDWSAATGAATSPAAYVHSGTIWALKQSVSDITQHEPITEDAYWSPVGSTGETANNANALGGKIAAAWQSDIDQIKEDAELAQVLALLD